MFGPQGSRCPSFRGMTEGFCVVLSSAVSPGLLLWSMQLWSDCSCTQGTLVFIIASYCTADSATHTRRHCLHSPLVPRPTAASALATATVPSTAVFMDSFRAVTGQIPAPLVTARQYVATMHTYVHTPGAFSNGLPPELTDAPGPSTALVRADDTIAMANDERLSPRNWWQLG